MLDLIERLVVSITTHMTSGAAGLTLPVHFDAERHMSFSLEPAVLPSLGLIAMKCRHSHLRRRAIELLVSTRRREALLQSEAMGLFHSGFVDIEEELARAFNSKASEECTAAKSVLEPGDVPEGVRFLDSTLYGETPSSTRVVFGRFAHEKDGELEIIQYIHHLGTIGRWPGTRWPVDGSVAGNPQTFEVGERSFTRYRC
jgi:hypothetical protein